MKYRFIKEQRGQYSVEKVARILNVSRSGYYSWISSPESHRERAEKELLRQIQEIQGKVHYRYGSPRITKELFRHGRKVGHNRVARIMRKNNLWARPKRRFVITTKSEEGQPVAENLLNREFRTFAVNRVWVSDITYIATAEGWIYLCTVIDLYSRRVVGWSMSTSLKTQIVLDAVRMALIRRHPSKGLLFHSDRGTQYTSIEFCETAKAAGFVQSMSRKGDCWDNACAETFFKTLKTELIQRTIYQSREEAEKAIFEYVEVFYNRVRLHSYLNYSTPVEYEDQIVECMAS